MILKQLWSSLELHPSFILNAAICFQSTLADGICLRPLLSLPRFGSESSVKCQKRSREVLTSEVVACR